MLQVWCCIKLSSEISSFAPCQDLSLLSLSLSCIVPPVISVAPELTYTPIFGDQLSITCDSTNTLVGEWIWYHNGIRIPNSNIFEVTTSANTLTIGSAHNKKHDGLYQCFAYNDAGNDSATTSVRVTSKCVMYCVNHVFSEVV